MKISKIYYLVSAITNKELHSMFYESHHGFKLIKLGVHDMDRLDHWGIDRTGNVVIVDYGFYYASEK